MGASLMRATMQVTDQRKEITGVILAGGQGRRLGGKDKGLVRLNKTRLIDLVIAALMPQVGALVINANRNTAAYSALGYPVVSDEMDNFQGPLAGFAAAMSSVRSQYILTVPCDAPWVAPDYAQRLHQAAIDAGSALAVAHDGKRLQPVHALIATSLLDDLRSFLRSGERKIDRWYLRHPMVRVDFSEQPSMFDNINTPEQQVALEGKLRNRV